ncbi:MAG: hypothetical protein KAJ79_07045, partial [Candidatus Omnitrophica bacterium]|nr:hypothetical protein [Candidatus Omnitrophota bacterium]
MKELERIIKTGDYKERVEFEKRSAKYAEELKQVMWKVEPLKAELILLAPFYMLQYQIRILLAKLSLIVPIEFSVVEFFVWRVILTIGSYILVRGTIPLLISNETAVGATLSTYLSGLPFGIGASINALGFALSLEAFLGIFLLVLFLDLLRVPVFSKNYLIMQAKNNIDNVDSIGKILIKSWSPLNRMDSLEKEGISTINYFAYKYKKYGIVATYKLLSFVTLALIAITIFTSPFISLFITAVATLIYINRNNEFWANFYSQQLLSLSKSSWSLFVLAGEIGLMVYFGSYIPVLSLIVKAFEIHALSWGNDVVTTLEYQTGTSFSGEVYYYLGGEDNLDLWWNDVYKQRSEIQNEVIKSSGIISPLTFAKENSFSLKIDDMDKKDKEFSKLISDVQTNDRIAKEKLKDIVRSFNNVELSKEYSDSYKSGAIVELGKEVYNGDLERVEILENVILNPDQEERLKIISLEILNRVYSTGDKDAVDVIEKVALKHDVSNGLRREAIVSLERISIDGNNGPSTESIERLVFVLKSIALDDNNTDNLRIAATGGLGNPARLGNQEALETIELIAGNLE